MIITLGLRKYFNIIQEFVNSFSFFYNWKRNNECRVTIIMSAN